MGRAYILLALTALIAPLASFGAVCLFPPRLRRILPAIPVLFLFISCISAFALLFTFWGSEPLTAHIDWFTAGENSFTAAVSLSSRSVVMLAAVSFISLLVHVFSLAYMSADADWKRYFAMLGFFTFSMQGIVISDNLLFLFIFWELVGFSSYMLIGHWTYKPEAGRAATKAFVMNRIGDAGFLVGLMIVWSTRGTFNLTDILLSPGQSWQTAASLCFFCGVIGKSAQFPLFTWLPDAMEGPTPVSALIHAATMVAAGVYLMVRLFPFFTEDALTVVAITGMLTTLIGAVAALSQYDIKKILAYSTMSQLGLMIVAIGMGVVDAALLHLLAHAFFKACLFLSAGIIIHSLQESRPANLHFDVQDIRNMGGLKDKLPLVFITFLVSGASLAGVPFFSGFLSKEAILTALFMHTDVTSWFMLAVILAVSFLTVLYTFRMMWFVFLGEGRTIHSLHIHKPGLLMSIPVIVLSACSLWLIVSWNPFNFKGWMLPHHETSAYASWLTSFSTLWVAAALFLGWSLFSRQRIRTSNLLRNAFYVDRAYTWLAEKSIYQTNRAVEYVDRRVLDRGAHGLAYTQVIVSHIISWIDQVCIDGTVNAVARLIGMTGKFTRSFQGGNIQLYIFWSVLAIIIFIISSLG